MLDFDPVRRLEEENALRQKHEQREVQELTEILGASPEEDRSLVDYAFLQNSNDWELSRHRMQRLPFLLRCLLALLAIFVGLFFILNPWFGVIGPFFLLPAAVLLWFIIRRINTLRDE